MNPFAMIEDAAFTFLNMPWYCKENYQGIS